MSSTILDYKFFSKCLGINEDKIYSIRRKAIDLSRNQIKTLKEYNMSHKTIKKNASKTIDVVDSILNQHADEKLSERIFYMFKGLIYMSFLSYFMHYIKLSPFKIFTS